MPVTQSSFQGVCSWQCSASKPEARAVSSYCTFKKRLGRRRGRKSFKMTAQRSRKEDYWSGKKITGTRSVASEDCGREKRNLSRPRWEIMLLAEHAQVLFILKVRWRHLLRENFWFHLNWREMHCLTFTLLKGCFLRFRLPQPTRLRLIKISSCD